VLPSAAKAQSGLWKGAAPYRRSTIEVLREAGTKWWREGPFYAALLTIITEPAAATGPLCLKEICRVMRSN
jgi:hypothetical protein